MLKLEAALADSGTCFFPPPSFSSSLFSGATLFVGVTVLCFETSAKHMQMCDFSVRYFLLEDEDSWSQVLILDCEHILFFFCGDVCFANHIMTSFTYILIYFLKKYGFHHLFAWTDNTTSLVCVCVRI